MAPSLLGVPAGELTDLRVALGQVWDDRRERRWCEELGTSDDPAAALTRLAGEVWRVGDRPPAWVAPAVGALGGGRPVSQVADTVGYSPRQFGRLVHARFGYGPQLLARILRFQRALPGLRAGLPVTQVAARTGYADAAHLHREVRALSGGAVALLRQDGSGA